MVAHWNDDDRDVSCVRFLGLRNKLAHEQQQLGYLSNEVDLWKFLDVFESDDESDFSERDDDVDGEDALFEPEVETDSEPRIESEIEDEEEISEEIEDNEDSPEGDDLNGHIMEEIAYKNFSYT